MAHRKATNRHKAAKAIEAKVQALAFDNSQAARKERIRVATMSQWHNRVSGNVAGFWKAANAAA